MKGREIKTRIPKKHRVEASAGSRTDSPKKLQTMKSAPQARDRKLVTKGGVAGHKLVICKPEARSPELDLRPRK
jgi:hypothetical protein